MSHASSTIKYQHIVIQNIHLGTTKKNGITNTKAKNKPAPPPKKKENHKKNSLLDIAENYM